MVKCRFAHTAQFRRFARPDGSAFPSLHNIGKVIRCLNHRSAKFHPVCLCRRNSLSLSLANIFALVLCNKGQHLKHNICKEGAHQIFTPPRIEQRHIYDRNIHFFLSRQIAPLTLYILVIPSKTVNAEDLYPSVFYNNLNIQKKRRPLKSSFFIAVTINCSFSRLLIGCKPLFTLHTLVLPTAPSMFFHAFIIPYFRRTFKTKYL